MTYLPLLFNIYYYTEAAQNTQYKHKIYITLSLNDFQMQFLMFPIDMSKHWILYFVATDKISQ